MRADAGLGAMQGEVRNRLFQAERSQGPGSNDTSPFEVKALSNLLGGIAGDRSRSPLVAQGAEVATQRAGELDAINQGFTGARDVATPNGRSFDATANQSPMQQLQPRQNQIL